jgi:hypothetical protein
MQQSHTFVDRRLASGQATGAIRFPTKEGSGVLRVRVKERGRGLFAASRISKGICRRLYFCFYSLCVSNSTFFAGHCIAQGTGKLVSESEHAPGMGRPPLHFLGLLDVYFVVLN